MYKTELKIFDAINRLEGKNGRRYTDAQIATATGLHRHTVRILRNGKPEPTIDKLLDFFASEGMPLTVGDLYETTVNPAT